MKSIFYPIIAVFIFSSTSIAQPTYQFEHFAMGATSNNAFTTNNFKCIAIGKGGVVWAGTQFGGLYMYSTTNHIWSKSDKLTNVFINDIKADADSGIWIAQSGTQSSGSVQSNIAGGVNYFKLATDAVMEFYSVAGTTTEAYLTSRNARSIYLDSSYKAADGELPRPWVALSTYLSSSTQRKGGVNVGLNAQSPFFDHLILGLGTQTSLICESVGGNSSEVWVGTRLNGTAGNVGSKIVRYTADKKYIGQYEPSNTPALQPGFAAQAIFFDSQRNKWIGLKQGGLRILKSNGAWASMNSSSFFDAATQVNFNAITEDELGNIYIGTSAGLLMYESPKYSAVPDPDLSSNYKLITTNDGLLNNNVTGVSYDKLNGKILIATSGGVSFLKVKYPYIHGRILNISTGINGVDSALPGYKTKPFEILGRVKAYLIKDGVEKEMALTEADGQFELKEADDTSSYTIEVRHNLPDTTIIYIYENIKNHTRLQPSLIPLDLVEELKALKPKLEERCFPMKLYFGFNSPSIFCTDDGFNTNNYNQALQWLYKPEGISSEHAKHVSNLANYYTTLATVYNLGGKYAEMVGETVTSFSDLIEALGGEFMKKEAIKKTGLQAIYDDTWEHFINTVTSLKEGVVYSANKLLVFVSNEEIKKMLEQVIAGTNETVDLLIEFAKEGKGQDAMNKALLDNIKKLFAQTMAVACYQESYAKTRHAYLIPQASAAAGNLQSGMSFEEGFEKLYSSTEPSLVKLATDTMTHGKTIMTTLSNASKLAEGVSNGLNFVSYLGLIPGGQALAAAARAASYASKGIKYFALLGSIYQGFVTATDVAELSDKTREKVNLDNYNNPGNYSYGEHIVESATDSLLARKNRYNAKLTELQSIYTAASFNETSFLEKRSQLKLQDSLFSAELKSVLNNIFSIADTASTVVENLNLRYNKLMDTFVDMQVSLKHAYLYRNLAFYAEADKSVDRAGIDSLVNELKIVNDSIVGSLQALSGDINNGNLFAKAFLVKENYSSNFSRVPGTNGTVTYSFKNYGGEPQNNVSFKITDVKAGYTILGADSVNVGTIAAGQTKSVTFTFKSPLHDSLSHYRIAVKANNGKYQDATGSFYAIDPNKCYSLKNGNWNDPATWSCGVVPGAGNKVYIMHQVTVTANVTCKDISIGQPGDLKVNTGIVLNILN